jgi:hypothetical protein
MVGKKGTSLAQFAKCSKLRVTSAASANPLRDGSFLQYLCFPLSVCLDVILCSISPKGCVDNLNKCSTIAVISRDHAGADDEPAVQREAKGRAAV